MKGSINAGFMGILLRPFDMPAMLGYISMKVKHFIPWGHTGGRSDLLKRK
jgi:hypothetical protein